MLTDATTRGMALLVTEKMLYLPCLVCISGRQCNRRHQECGETTGNDFAIKQRSGLYSL